MLPQITVARKQGKVALAERIRDVTRLAAYVGVPASGAGTRQRQLTAMAGAVKGVKKRARLQKIASQAVTNAELLFIHTKGSPLKRIPARPVLEPAVKADGNREPIARELAASAKASLAGDKQEAVRRMERAALVGQNAARRWFTDPRNGWAPNAPGTIRRKGSDRPLIDTGALRAAIVGVVREE